jgi:hypothetical protein
MFALALTLVLAQEPSTLKPSLPGAVFKPSSIQTTRAGEGSTFSPNVYGAPSTLPGANTNPLVKRVTIVEGRAAPCETLAVVSTCDDVSVVEAKVVNEPLVVSDAGPPLVPHLAFVGLKAGRTTCACGISRDAFQLVYDITVIGLDEAMLPVARKVVVAAFERRYTVRGVQVP